MTAATSLSGARPLVAPARLPCLAAWLGVSIVAVVATPSLWAAPGTYEAGFDPGVGFNLVSWANFAAGETVWEEAVEAVAAAGFDEVSLSPVRFYTPSTGAIAATSSAGPELAHVAAGVARAKQLGLRVTVNPFVEPVGFSSWRGVYDPTPQTLAWGTFWSDYQAYLVDVEPYDSHAARNRRAA